MSLGALVAVVALAAALGLAGSRFAAAFAVPGEGALQRGAVAFAAGALALHLLLGALQLAGAPWTRATIVLALALLAAAAHRLLPRPAERTRLPSDLGWGDGVALFALAASTLVALTLWTATPDFAYHWGLKGHRFFLARGVDWAWLGRSWNAAVHPDYPNLLPELYAASAALAGRFDPAAQMAWSALFLALALGAAREVAAGGEPALRQPAVALAGLVVGMVALAPLLAGGADGMIALALLAAVPALVREDRPAGAAGPGSVQIGLLAAFAAAAKVEGVALAAFLVLVRLVQRGRRLGARELAGLLLPPALVVLPWWLAVHRHGLAPARAGGLDPRRLAVVLPTLAESLAHPAWHGLTLALLLVPLLALGRRTRPVAAVAALQLAFYLGVYATMPADPRFLVLSSFPRLAFHLVPALLAAAVVWRWR